MSLGRLEALGLQGVHGLRDLACRVEAQVIEGRQCLGVEG